jgi:putative N6-adenine-specific DNA methylase
MYLYQRTHTFFAQVAESFKDLALAELVALGARDLQPVYRGIHFRAERAVLYRVNLGARLVTRVLAPLAEFTCRDADELYRRAREVDWPGLFGLSETFAVEATVHDHANLAHTHYAALKLKDAVVDRFRDAHGRRPDVDAREPDVRLHLHLEGPQATVSLDTSGGSLHRRGYRRAAFKAPMQETLAAAVIRLTDWDGAQPLYDPLCGSGTLLAEALMHACRVPAGSLRRSFGFQRLPDFDARLWREVQADARAAQRDLSPGLIAGSDTDASALAAARRNLGALPAGERVVLRREDFRRLTGLGGHLIVCNPPYGRRLDGGSDLGAFYRDLGDWLKQRCNGATAFVYAGERELIKHIGLRPAWKKPLAAGGLDGRLVKYELY